MGGGPPLEEIKNLVEAIDGEADMGDRMRSLSSRKLDEVEAPLARTRAMKGWLEVAKEYGCATPAECALFPGPRTGVRRERGRPHRGSHERRQLPPRARRVSTPARATLVIRERQNKPDGATPVGNGDHRSSKPA
jgi:hypothetical protein